MENINEALIKAVDMLPALGTKPKVDPLGGWGVKVMLVAAVVQLIMSAMGSWKRFGMVLIIELIIAILGIWFNRHGHEVMVWIMAVLAIGSTWGMDYASGKIFKTKL